MAQKQPPPQHRQVGLFSATWLPKGLHALQLSSNDDPSLPQGHPGVIRDHPKSQFFSQPMQAHQEYLVLRVHPIRGPLRVTWRSRGGATPRVLGRPLPLPPPPPPLGAFGQQLVAKGVALRPPWAPKAPDAT